jgi:hypothetical protein
MANMAIRMTNLPLGIELPKLLKLLFYGGPENWCETLFLFESGGGRDSSVLGCRSPGF